MNVLKIVKVKILLTKDSELTGKRPMQVKRIISLKKSYDNNLMIYRIDEIDTKH